MSAHAIGGTADADPGPDRGRDAFDIAMATTFGGSLLESMLVRAEKTA